MTDSELIGTTLETVEIETLYYNGEAMSETGNARLHMKEVPSLTVVCRSDGTIGFERGVTHREPPDLQIVPVEVFAGPARVEAVEHGVENCILRVGGAELIFENFGDELTLIVRRYEHGLVEERAYGAGAEVLLSQNQQPLD